MQRPGSCGILIKTIPGFSGKNFTMRAIACLSLVLAVTFPALTGCVPKKSQGAVLAHFEGETITDTEFYQRLEGLPRELKAAALSRKKDFVEEMVNRIEAMGLEPKIKPDSFVASSYANRFTK